MAHFHIPKPLHGWREFVGEVGIIVLGVLFALSAGQIVEAIHWSYQTQAARDALNAEASDNLNSAAIRQQQQRCIDRRLAEIAAIFEDHAQGQPIQIHGRIGRPVFYGGEDNAWKVEVGGQAISRMSIGEKLRYAGAFGNYADLRDTLLREQESWLRLQILDNPEILQDGDWPVLHQAFSEADSLNRRLGVITSDILTNDTLGQRRPAVKFFPNF